MYKPFSFIVFFSLLTFAQVNSWIRINQLGYLPNDSKVAVLASKENPSVEKFGVYNFFTDELVHESDLIKAFTEWGPFASSFRLNFTSYKKQGVYYIKVNDISSPPFRINKDIYNGAADFLLHYMRQQRCGYNPWLKDSCHVHDGFIIYHPSLDSTYIDVKGGWHDASDYLQYVTTSANATYQMLFAYQENPQAFGDYYNANGEPGSNGIPDILDEAKWGLDWLVKMNPSKELMFNQIADDRDHQGFRLPNKDSISYNGKDLQRPVYFCSGEPQGVFKHKNRATGTASTAGKYSSAFALGAELLKDYYPEFSMFIREKSIEAYEFGLAKPGVCQTAPCRAPYFYEEDNYADDMQLAAIQLHNLFGNHYLQEAIEYGKSEPVTPWMGADTANHYQWYPFLNLGHYYLAKGEKPVNKLFLEFMKSGIEKIFNRGKDNPFLYGVPFIWCSNNLVAAALTQIRLYNRLTKDDTYAEMEGALRDWLLGCNPWGTSMIIGMPAYGVYPKDPHAALTHFYGIELLGGLVDGPVYASIFNRLLGITIYNGDEYEEFQSDIVVYHDDYGDYSTNEPTMDGTASLSFYFSSLANDKLEDTQNQTYSNGGIIRFDKTQKEIYLVFTGGDFADGGEIIRNTMKKNNVKGAFFFTGDFYRNLENEKLINKLLEDGHYLGAHSDKHLLYCDWTKRDSTLITKEEFTNDIKNNFKEMARFGIKPEDARWFIPPYEWYNEEISKWCEEIGLKILSFTPGTYSNADYTIPSMGKRYLSSDIIYDKIFEYEKNDKNGLNGVVLLVHVGTDSERTDKFYNKLERLINEFKSNGYSFGEIK